MINCGEALMCLSVITTETVKLCIGPVIGVRTSKIAAIVVVTLRPDNLSTHRPRDRNNCLLTAPAPAKCTPFCLLTIDPVVVTLRPDHLSTQRQKQLFTDRSCSLVAVTLRPDNLSTHRPRDRNNCLLTAPAPAKCTPSVYLLLILLLLHCALTTCRPRDRNNCLLTAPAPVKCTPFCLLTIDPSCLLHCALTTCTHRPRDRNNCLLTAPAPVKCTPLCLLLLILVVVTLRPDHLSTQRQKQLFTPPPRQVHSTLFTYY
ncbi:hypothetical protein J6590_016403 [Homalodisca vitripennis]|nr:hypothetical protein J6590_016403 [Homalodisca vitripennis]